jgi:hypothetical protein
MDPLTLGLIILGAAAAAALIWWLLRRKRKQREAMEEQMRRMMQQSQSGDEDSSSQEPDWESIFNRSEQLRIREAEERERQKQKQVRDILQTDSDAAAELLRQTGSHHSNPVYAAEDNEEVARIARQLDDQTLQTFSVAAKPITQIDNIELGIEKTEEPVEYPTRDIRFENMDSTEDLTRIVPEDLMDDDLMMAGIAQNDLHVMQPYATTVNRKRVYLLIDISQSMDTKMSDGLSRMTWAAGVAVKMLLMAEKGEAEFLLRFFDGNTHKLVRINTPDDARKLIAELMRIVASGGSTDITGAIRQAAKDIRTAKLDIQTNNIMIISDAEDNLDEATLRHILGDDIDLHAAVIALSSPPLKSVAKSYQEYS